ncbi:M42 family metallopeptidase [Isachenkonia alkalipeptolytica]|uniref:M42 family metallopeptidase n=1 Tax=Isachenkonia alkalipeptolytica TaxID=2565777 RepID=A0AA44BE87_9CLOT|nr:M42 family metallopeptidase [Isachenkonia alkalipeptolytica]NBG88752.1 M42 family metallopeptidase [Isachenkonia alkalipeptolytica]
MEKLNVTTLDTLLSTYGPSGNEEAVRELIKSEIKDYVDELHVDALGNLIARKKGQGKKIMLAGHMDQIGLMVTYIDKEGFMRFTNVGGISPTISLSQRVVFENGTIGVIGSEHLESLKDLKLDKMYIDIGANSKQEAEELVNIGDVCGYFEPPVIDDQKVISPSLDDRIGCYIMMETIKNLKDSVNDLFFVFTVQEELGLRGAKTAAYRVEPDIGIAYDVTMTGDTPKARTMALKMGEGFAIKAKDNSMISHPGLKNYLIEEAKKQEVDYQIEVLEFGGTDSGAIHLSKEGVPSSVLSIPTRYIHSTCEMVSVKDVLGAINYSTKLLSTDFNF